MLVAGKWSHFFLFECRDILQNLEMLFSEFMCVFRIKNSDYILYIMGVFLKEKKGFLFFCVLRELLLYFTHFHRVNKQFTFFYFFSIQFVLVCKSKEAILKLNAACTRHMGKFNLIYIKRTRCYSFSWFSSILKGWSGERKWQFSPSPTCSLAAFIPKQGKLKIYCSYDDQYDHSD